MVKESGTELIAKERSRQYSEKGWNTEHDDEHSQGELAMAACCYAAPELLLVADKRADAVIYSDPWPWANKYDKRFSYGTNKIDLANYRPDPKSYTQPERIDLLIKAGALIAAEIDRLQRQTN